MAKVENANVQIPVRTESESRVRSTLVTTLPQTIVDNVKLESLRRARTLVASRFPPPASTSRRSLLTLKIAKCNPEKIADCVIHKAIPVQVSDCARDVEYVISKSNRLPCLWFKLIGTRRSEERSYRVFPQNANI